MFAISYKKCWLIINNVYWSEEVYLCTGAWPPECWWNTLAIFVKSIFRRLHLKKLRPCYQMSFLFGQTFIGHSFIKVKLDFSEGFKFVLLLELPSRPLTFHIISQWCATMHWIGVWRGPGRVTMTTWVGWAAISKIMFAPKQQLITQIYEKFMSFP